MSDDAEKVRKPHTCNANGVFLCPAVGKHVTVVTVSRGFKACGHCINPLYTEAGEKIPYTMREHLLARIAEGW
jgi:hypothetical protein